MVLVTKTREQLRNLRDRRRDRRRAKHLHDVERAAADATARREGRDLLK